MEWKKDKIDIELDIGRDRQKLFNEYYNVQVSCRLLYIQTVLQMWRLRKDRRCRHSDPKKHVELLYGLVHDIQQQWARTTMKCKTQKDIIQNTIWDNIIWYAQMDYKNVYSKIFHDRYNHPIVEDERLTDDILKGLIIDAQQNYVRQLRFSIDNPRIPMVRGKTKLLTQLKHGLFKKYPPYSYCGFKNRPYLVVKNEYHKKYVDSIPEDAKSTSVYIRVVLDDDLRSFKLFMTVYYKYKDGESSIMQPVSLFKFKHPCIIHKRKPNDVDWMNWRLVDEFPLMYLDKGNKRSQEWLYYSKDMLDYCWYRLAERYEFLRAVAYNKHQDVERSSTDSRMKAINKEYEKFHNDAISIYNYYEQEYVDKLNKEHEERMGLLK